jgi:hypothetical protein
MADMRNFSYLLEVDICKEANEMRMKFLLGIHCTYVYILCMNSFDIQQLHTYTATMVVSQVTSKELNVHGICT